MKACKYRDKIIGYLVEDSEGFLHYVKQQRNPYLPEPKNLWDLLFGEGFIPNFCGNSTIGGFDWAENRGR